MLKFLKKLINRKPEAILLNNQFRIVPAFTWKGTTYFMNEDPMATATGRGLTALTFMEELLMRCNVEYLKNHTAAMDKLLSGPKIDIGNVSRLNLNLKERINFLVAVPDHIYKLASVVFFTKKESPFRYDEAFNKKKIEAWKKDKNMYDFFLQQTRLKDMLPFLSLPQDNSPSYSKVQQKINTMHLKNLQEILSKNQSTTGSLN